MESCRDKLAQQGELARALADLGSLFSDQKSIMHEVSHERLAGRALRLRNFVLVMHRDVIYPAGMNVQSLAKVSHRHRGTLDIPARISAPPRTIPLHQMPGLVQYPQHEIVRAAFVGRMFNTLTRILLV